MVPGQTLLAHARAEICMQPILFSFNFGHFQYFSFLPLFVVEPKLVCETRVWARVAHTKLQSLRFKDAEDILWCSGRGNGAPEQELTVSHA